MGAQRPGVAADGELPAAHRYLVARTVKLPKFSGATQLEPYLAQFSSVSGTTAGVTGGSCPPRHGEGTAVQVLSDLSPEDQRDLQPLTGALERGFGQDLDMCLCVTSRGCVSVCNFTRLCVCV